MIFSLLLVFFYSAVVVGYVAYCWETYLNRSRPDRVVYYSSNLKEQGKVLEAIIKKYITARGEATADYALVEPGAGFAHMARFLAQKYTWREIIAVEIGRVVLLIGRLLSLLRQDHITFIYADIFSYTVPQKSLVYCYLTSAIITRLYQEGKLNGQLVVCLTFTIEGVEPTEEIELKSWQKRIQVYDFREASPALKAASPKQRRRLKQ